VAAENIAVQLRGQEPTKRESFGDIPAVCIMDAGNNGVVILADRMLPPRKHGVMIPGPQSHAAKLAFEKYFLWKMRHGYVGCRKAAVDPVGSGSAQQGNQPCESSGRAYAN
jgi:sulfide:quinone oxidoreductase